MVGYYRRCSYITSVLTYLSLLLFQYCIEMPCTMCIQYMLVDCGKIVSNLYNVLQSQYNMSVCKCGVKCPINQIIWIWLAEWESKYQQGSTSCLNSCTSTAVLTYLRDRSLFAVKQQYVQVKFALVPGLVTLTTRQSRQATMQLLGINLLSLLLLHAVTKITEGVVVGF